MKRCRKHHEPLRLDITGVPFCHTCKREDEIETRHAVHQRDPRVLAYAGHSAHADGLQTLD